MAQHIGWSLWIALPLYFSWSTLSYIWFDCSKPSIDQTWVSLWSIRWDKRTPIGEWVNHIDSKQLWIHWRVIHQIQVTCSFAQKMWDLEEGISIDSFHPCQIGSWILSFCVNFSCYWACYFELEISFFEYILWFTFKRARQTNSYGYS